MSGRIASISFIALLLFLPACMGVPFNETSREPVMQPIYMPNSGAVPREKRDPASGAALWRESTYRNAFQDLRAHQVGDLLTVNIVETSKATKKAITKTARQSSIDAGINNLMGWEGKIGKLGLPGEFKHDQMFKASLKNGFDGSGETSRDETMTASITTRVIQVMPNGNLFIKGTREIKVNNETQNIILTGLVRPADISPDNTILSSYLAEAKIEYTGTGSVSDKQRPGWLMRIVDYVWPF